MVYDPFNRLNKPISKEKVPTIVNDKGEHNGTCNRSACDKKRAVFYNKGTYKYYCPSCARLINEYAFGGDILCTYEPEKLNH